MNQQEPSPETLSALAALYRKEAGIDDDADLRTRVEKLEATCHMLGQTLCMVLDAAESAVKAPVYSHGKVARKARRSRKKVKR